MFTAATELDLNPRLLSLDINRPSILTELGEPELCVVGKVNHFDDSRVQGFAMATLSVVARMKARNVRVALLYCDHLAPLSDSRGMVYRDLLALADQIIVPCKAMADRAKHFSSTSTPIKVIEDPWQVRLQNYQKFDPSLPLRIGWFGNANNITFLCAHLNELMRSVVAAPSINFVVLSNETGLKLAKSAFHESLPSALRPWNLELIQWDDSQQPNQLEQVLGSVHVVWLPSNPQSPIKGGVSHNRLVDAVRSGSVVVASEMQSYQELSQLALLGPDHGNMINQLIPQYKRLSLKYESLRKELLQKFSPDLNRERWKNLLKESL